VPASEHEHHHHHHNEADSAPATVASAYVLMIALSLHAVFEGIALGLQDSVGKVFTLAIGLMAHKWVEVQQLSYSIALSSIYQVVWSCRLLRWPHPSSSPSAVRHCR
jgi:zinc transporter 1/2/3